MGDMTTHVVMVGGWRRVDGYGNSLLLSALLHFSVNVKLF